ELRERLALASFAVEISRREPALERLLERRPFAIEDRVPGGIAVAALVDDRLAENAFEAEAEAVGGLARRRVERIAFPFITAVAELVEGAAHHQIHGFGCRAALLQARRIDDRSHFDRADGRIDPHVAR